MATVTLSAWRAGIEQPISEPKLTTFPYTANESFVGIELETDK